MSFFDKYIQYRLKEQNRSQVTQHLPWIEKYRPKDITNVASQEETIRILKRSIQNRNLPHLLFYGPPGTGKTSTILAICRQLYHAEYRDYVLELNASDERGINVVRSKIKTFAQGKTGIRKDIPPYKIIILDEADSMTKEAQAALRRTIEDFAKVTRFCLICNHLNKIIEPLASRCAPYRFNSLPTKCIRDKLKEIADAEGIEWNDQIGDVLCAYSHGDLRKAINLLQSIHNQFGNVTLDILENVVGRIPDDLINNLLNITPDKDKLPLPKTLTQTPSNPQTKVQTSSKLQTNTVPTISFSAMIRAVDDILAEGFTADQILNRVVEWMVSTTQLSDIQKCRFSQKMAEVDKCLAEGADEHIQLYDLFGYYKNLVQ